MRKETAADTCVRSFVRRQQGKRTVAGEGVFISILQALRRRL